MAATVLWPNLHATESVESWCGRISRSHFGLCCNKTQHTQQTAGRWWMWWCWAQQACLAAGLLRIRVHSLHCIHTAEPITAASSGRFSLLPNRLYQTRRPQRTHGDNDNQKKYVSGASWRLIVVAHYTTVQFKMYVLTHSINTPQQILFVVRIKSI